MHSPPLDALVLEIGLRRLPTSLLFCPFASPSLSPSPDLDRERLDPWRRHVEERPHAPGTQQQHASAAAHQLPGDARDHKRVRGPDRER